MKQLSPSLACATGRRGLRSAFTLFEVILAIALSTVLLVLIGTAVNLYLTRIEARRNDVEWAQLARQIFTIIGEDLRATSEYRPQDLTGALAATGSSTTNVGSIIGSSGATGSGEETGQTSGSASGGAMGFGMSSGTSTGTSGSSTGAVTGAVGTTMYTSLITTPGIHGSLIELFIDTNRAPRLDELFRNRSGYVNAVVIPNEAPTGRRLMMSSPTAMAALQAPESDLKTVRYFVRQGAAIDADSVDATSLSPDAQYEASGLVRQEIDRAKRVWAEQSGDASILESGQRLLAPEVVALEFRYFDGATVLEAWEMQAMGLLPIAVEIRLWLADPEDSASPDVARQGAAALAAGAREFRQMVFLPTARPPDAAATTTGTGTGTSTGTSTTGTSTGS